MYLKKLRLSGFKSFADPTEFDFHRGTTAVVGPNGCGKSNVVDAFRWVLGERSAKELRGQEMMDVIFKGTSQREPLGRAEVSVVFDNSCGTLPVEFAEVEVTRRLFRSGESEYLINQRRCRLKDVRALFADTGIGTEGYSIMEQGSVDRFLNSTPMERREIFEQAAGISRYRKQTAQALRQLDRVEANVERLVDIRREVERRIHSVKIQAGRARRYLEDRDKLIKLKSVLARHEIDQHRDDREELTFQLALLEARREMLTELATRTRQRRDAAGRGADSATQSLADLRNEELRLEVAGERITERRAHIAENQHELDTAGKVRARQLDELTEVERDYAARRQEVRDGVRAELERLRALRIEFDAVDAERIRYGDEKRATEQELHTAKERGLSLLFTETRLHNELNSHESEDRGLEALAGRRRREGEEFESEASALARQLTDVEVEREQGARWLERSLENCQILEREVERREQRLGETQRDLSQLRERLQRDQAHLRLLEGLEERREGVSAGARRLLEMKHPLGRDVVGLLASVVEVTAELAPLVDVALGAHSETVVLTGGTPTDDRARALAELLGEDGVTFCDIERMVGTDDVNPDGHERLVDRISCEPRHRPLLERLLGDVRIVDDVETALTEAPRTGRRHVTRQGWLVHPWGAITIPARTGNGLVSRRSEIRRLRSEVTVRARKLGRVSQIASGLELAIEARRDELRRAVEETRRGQLETETHERRYQEIARESARLRDRIHRVQQELEEFSEARRRVASDLEAVRQRVDDVEAERACLEEEITAREERLVELEECFVELDARLGQLRIEATQREERILALRREEMRIVGEIQERVERRRYLEDEERRVGERRTAFENELAELGTREGQLTEEHEALTHRVQKAEQEATARREELAAAERVAVQSRELEDTLRNEREQALLGENEARVLITTIRDKIIDEFSVDLAEAPIDEWAAELRQSGGGGSGGGDDDDDETGGDNVAFRQRLAEECERTQERLRRNSNVNLQAVEELDELEERHEHLATQMTDVDQSRAKLVDTIESLNRTSREQFLATFTEIRKHFRELFAKVFNGGTADLRLEEGVEDVLEAGVEVVAQPPGKRISSLKLLSGGEKALTAVAVLFALFRYKPSPFCLLDEVDAPLDEANTRRYIQILKEFTGQSQFVMITHSKVTMLEAERLYGITMEEKGVSTRVQVRLEDVGDHLDQAVAVHEVAVDEAAEPEVAQSTGTAAAGEPPTVERFDPDLLPAIDEAASAFTSHTDDDIQS